MTNYNKILCLFTTFIFALLVPCNAIKVGKGLVRIDDQNFGLFSTNTPLNITDTRISLGFTLVDEVNSNIKTGEFEFLFPKQVIVTLSSENIESEMYFTPKLVEQKIYELNIPVNKISSYLLSQDKIDIQIITGDDDESLNSIIKAGSILPSEKLKIDRAVELPTRFGVKNEIIHIFKSDPKNLPSFISTQYVFLLMVSLVVLLLAWNYFQAANINNLLKFNPMVSLFLLSIFLFEYYFFDYYLGTSIFKSLKRFALTGICSLYFGSKTLKDMYKLRSANLR